MRALLPVLLLLAPPALALVPLPSLPPPLDQLPLPPATVLGTLLPLPLGTLTLGGASRTCMAGFTCQAFTVTCPLVSAPINGTFAVAEPTAPARGVAMFFSGGGGTGFELGQTNAAFVDQLRADGFRLVQVAWSTGWLLAPAGEQAGFGRLACRPATAIRFAFDHFYTPLGLDPARGVCGFCITGNSGGSTQVGFALSHYGLEKVLDGDFPTGGPPHAALQKACSSDPALRAYEYPDGTRAFIDEGWGFYDKNGPCLRHDALWQTRFTEDSVAWGGSDYNHPDTRVHLFVGAFDQQQQPQAGDYRDRLTSAGSPMVALTIVPNTPHFVLGTAEGQAAVRAALLEVP